MAANPRPPLIAPEPAGVPEQMRVARRWAPWRAEWDPKAAKGRGKWVKIPHRAARPEHGLSNKSTAGWVSFDEAMAVYRAHPDRFAGVGYLMTGPHGVTGVDLDHCRDPVTGRIDEWALEIAAKLDSYTEVSPSGTGLHIMVAGTVPEDWTNHDQGIEVYGGNEARFLCITGRRVPGPPDVLRPAREGVVADLEARYRKTRTKAEVEDLHLPELLPVDLLPTLAELDLPPHAANFLTDGPEPGRDRSQQLFAASIALHQAGLAKDEVLSILEANEHAMEIALDHRRQDYDKALRYLWKQHCQAGAARAAQLREDAIGVFDDLMPEDEGEENDLQVAGESAGGAGDALDDFDVLPPEDGAADNRHADLAPVKRARFAPLLPEQFMQRKPMSWLVRGVLPEAGLAVIYGASAAGKTFLTLDLVAAISRGVDWRGLRTTRGRGVYIVAEGAEGFRTRMQAYCEFHGVSPGDLAIGVIPDAPNLMDKAQVKELILALKAFGQIDYVVIDTYARVMVGGNENDAKDAGLMVAHCAQIHKHTGALVILVHHSGKDPASGARGSSVLRAAADVEIEVIRTREYRAARIGKMKDGDDSGEFRFVLDTVELGENDDGDAITSCVVRHQDGGVAAQDAGGPLKGHAATVYTTLADLIDLGAAPTYAELIDLCVARIPHEEGKRDRRRDTVTRAIEKLQADERIKMDGPLVVIS
jgi:hypothetical protein